MKRKLPVSGRIARHMARQPGYSARGLHRALRAEGASFAAVLSGLRHRFAVGYLSEQGATLAEIARLVGLSDVSAFFRAFGRREGISPGGLQRRDRA